MLRVGLSDGEVRLIRRGLHMLISSDGTRLSKTRMRISAARSVDKDPVPSDVESEARLEESITAAQALLDTALRSSAALAREETDNGA